MITFDPDDLGVSRALYFPIVLITIRLDVGDKIQRPPDKILPRNFIYAASSPLPYFVRDFNDNLSRKRSPSPGVVSLAALFSCNLTD